MQLYIFFLYIIPIAYYPGREVHPVQILIAAAAAIVLAYFSKRAKTERELKNAGLKRIKDVNNGETVRITGKVELVTEPLTAPLSGRKCAYYHVIVEQKVSAITAGNRWRTLLNEQRSNTFVLRDGDKCAYIQDNNLTRYIVNDREYKFGFFDGSNAIVKAYLEKHGTKSEDILGKNITIHYKEWVLENGNPVTIFGKGTWKTATQTGLPGHYGKILVISADDEDLT